jgi:hypothetical protein
MNYEAKMANRLAAKIQAQNQLGTMINEWHPKIKAILEKWVGQKVSLVTGGQPVKLKQEIEALGLPNYHAGNGNIGTKQITVSFDLYSAIAHYSVSINCFHDGSQRAEQTVCLGDLLNGLILKDLHYDFKPFKTDYWIEGVLAARKAVKDAEDALSNAKSSLYPFPEHDNF